jgi:tape measure domain-containing protein
MNDVGIDLILRGQMAGGKAVQRALDDVEKSADKATGALSEVEKQTGKTGQASNRAAAAIGQLDSIIGLLQAHLKASEHGTLRLEKAFAQGGSAAAKLAEETKDAVTATLAAAKAADEAARAEDRLSASTKRVVTTFESMESRVGAAERRLKELALSGKGNSERFQRLAAQTTEYRSALTQAESAVAKATGSMQHSTDAADLMRRTLIGLSGALGVREAIRFSDQITIMETRLRNVTRGADDFRQKFDALFAVAQRNGDVFNDLVGSYVQLNTALPDSVRYTTDLVKITDLLSRGFAASGTSAQASSAVMIQLTQGLAGNFANASQEINSLIEGAPLLARTIAEQLGGKAATDLKKFATEGKLTAETFMQALLDAEGAIAKMELPPTIGRSWERVTNEITRMGSESATLEAVATGLAGTLDFVAENMDTVIAGVTVLAGAIVGSLVPAMLSAVKTAALLAAGLATGPGAVFIAVGAAAGALLLLADRTTEVDRIQQQNATTLDKVRELNEKMAQASGKTAEALREEREEIFQTTLQRINATKALLNEAIARQQIVDSQNSRAGAGGIWGGMAVSQASTETQNLRDQLNEMSNGLNDLLDEMYAPKPATAKSVVQRSAEDADRAKKSHDELQKAINGSKTAEEQLIDEIAKMEGMRPLADARGKAEDLAEAIARANDELDQLRIQSERNGPVARAFESLTNQIDDGMRESFREAFVASDRGWKSLLDGWKAGFKAFLAEIAYTALMRPIVLQLAGGIGASIGLSSGTLSQIMGEQGASGLGGLFGGGSVFSLSNLSSIGGLLNGGLFSGTLAGVGQGIGNIISGVPWGAAYGPQLPGVAGVSGLGTTLGSAFGNLGYGALGGFGASMLGLGSQNAYVNAGFGTVGSLIGGGAFGPLGAAAGGFIGTAVGGLFGGKSIPSQYIGAQIGTDNGLFANGAFGSDEANASAIESYRTLQQTTTDSLNSLLTLMGATVGAAPTLEYNTSGKRDGGRIRVGVGGIHTLGGTQSAMNTQAVFTDAEDAVNYAVLTTLQNSRLDGIGSQLEAYFKKALSASTSVEQAMSDIQLIQNIFGDTEDATQTAAEAIASINEQFDAMLARAKALGLPMDEVNAKLEEQRDASIGLVRAMDAGFQSMEAMKATFDSWLYDQSLGSTSTLSPTQKLLEAQDNFGSLLEQIRGGDSAKTQELLASATQLLQLGQNMYASSVDFALLETFVRDSIGSVARQLGVQGYATGTMSARTGVRWVGERGPELVNFKGGERVYNAEESKMLARSGATNDARFVAMDESITGMREDIGRMTKQLSRVANQMIVSGRK